ncbi:MAG: ABC transporter permease [Gemmatimonadota bacterium]|nr:ABC transporter permease [Gemmatimonadota bacterium]
MESLRQDLRFTLRSLRKSPGFAVVATVTLALAIGVNTSIFSLVSAIVFADLPMRDAETALIVRGINPELGIERGSVSAADYVDLVERARSFDELAALTEEQLVMTGVDRPERVSAMRATVNTFDAWRLPPLLGRAFTEEEGTPGAESVAMLTHGFWQARFDAAPDVLGQTIRLDGIEHTVVGVAHPDLEFASFREAQVLVPMQLDRSSADRRARNLFVSGRLAPGVTHQMAEEEVRGIGEALSTEHPELNGGWALWSAPVMDSLMDDDGRTIMLLLQLTVAMVILIACANVANMLLARATAREREIAIRTALGAERWRLVRQLLTESLAISLAAGSTGLAVAYALNEALIWVSAGTEEILLMAEIDGRVLAFTLLVSLLAPVAFGLFPALRASGLSASTTLRASRSGDGDRAGKRARNALVTAQVSLALTLMITAGLLVRTVVNIHARPLGYDPGGLLTVRVDLPENDYPRLDDASRFFIEAQEAIGALPGFGETNLVSALPGIGFGALRPIELESVVQQREGALPSVLFSTVDPNLFAVLGIGIVEGRGFEPTDDAGSLPVAILSQEVANRYLDGRGAVGRRLRVGGEAEWLQIVGVVADVRSPSGGTPELDGSALNVYVPYEQSRSRGMYIIARTTMDPTAGAGAVREAIWNVDADLPVGRILSMEQADYERSASDMALITLFVTFAMFALVMAGVGIYGVMAYSVAQRRSEIGVRMALGARGATVRWMVLGQGGRLLVAGVLVGLALSLGVSRLLQGLVVGVSATDPLTFIGVPVLLGLVALVANLIPARRATRTDPAITLREG